MNLLDRARNLLQGIAPAAPAKVQYYSVACPEGHRLRGERTEGYQALRCPTCGEGIFVLPRSPLPEPTAPPSARTPRQTLRNTPAGRDDEPVALTDPIASQQFGNDDVDGEIEWIEPEPGAPPKSTTEPEVEQKTKSKAPAGPDERRGPRPVRRATPRPKAPVPAEPSVPINVRLAEWARQRRHRLFFLAVACVVLATVGYSVRSSWRQDLPRVAEIGKIQGLAALDSGDRGKFVLANQLLSEAKRAVELMGDAYEGSGEIRRGAAEAAIFVNLVPATLEGILDQAGRNDRKSWESDFATNYRGRAILIEAYVTRVPDASGSGRYDLDYRIFPNGEGVAPPSVGRIDLTGLRLFEVSRPKVGEKVLFGATLDSLRLDKESEEWLFGLDPESGVWITHVKALEALGWPSEDELQGEAKP